MGKSKIYTDGVAGYAYTQSEQEHPNTSAGVQNGETITYTVPDGAKSLLASHSNWSSGGYFDVYICFATCTTDSNWQFHRIE